MTVKSIVLAYMAAIRNAMNGVCLEIESLDAVGYQWDDHEDDQVCLDHLGKLFNRRLEKEMECVFQELRLTSIKEPLKFTLPGVCLPGVKVVITPNCGISEQVGSSPNTL